MTAINIAIITRKRKYFCYCLVLFLEKFVDFFIVIPISSCYFRFHNNATQRCCYIDIIILYYYVSCYENIAPTCV